MSTHGKPRFRLTLPHSPARVVLPEHEGMFFDAIERRTGLDRAMAEAILLSGKDITHPDATFSKLDHEVKP